ncbi:MAG: M48 family metallopeptidase [Armatimonadetes bacterium]|nr:M48 family metallopeptidase [Armatimonadota bacterium]MCX7968707.1 M48 family metallopeptidase [Armatimonadota bacterium]MDW8142202.1 M48 family metallopeptidase [Armatimonadota bacterium]
MKAFAFSIALSLLLAVSGLVGQDESSKVPAEWQGWGAETDWELTAIAQLLLQGEPNANKFKDVLVLPLKEANAFVNPDGYLIVTEGLLERLNGRDEIAFVIAHELAHLIKGHPRNLETDPTRLERIRTEVERGLGTSVVGTGLQVLVGAVASYYNREREREADAEAVRLMAKAGFDLNGARRALRNLSDEKGFLSWFRSHPFLNERLEIVNGAIRRWRTSASAPPKLTPPPDRANEVYVELQVAPWAGTERALWQEFAEEVKRGFWSSLLEVTQQMSCDFHPVKRWQRHRAKTWTLQIVPTNWQTLPLPYAGDWIRWEVRMNWQLQNEKGEVWADQEERFSITFGKDEALKSAVLSSAPLFARRLARFVVKNCYKGDTAERKGQ